MSIDTLLCPLFIESALSNLPGIALIDTPEYVAEIVGPNVDERSSASDDADHPFETTGADVASWEDRQKLDISATVSGEAFTHFDNAKSKLKTALKYFERVTRYDSNPATPEHRDAWDNLAPKILETLTHDPQNVMMGRKKWSSKVADVVQKLRVFCDNDRLDRSAVIYVRELLLYLSASVESARTAHRLKDSEYVLTYTNDPEIILNLGHFYCDENANSCYRAGGLHGHAPIHLADDPDAFVVLLSDPVKGRVVARCWGMHDSSGFGVTNFYASGISTQAFKDTVKTTGQIIFNSMYSRTVNIDGAGQYPNGDGFAYGVLDRDNGLRFTVKESDAISGNTYDTACSNCGEGAHSEETNCTVHDETICQECTENDFTYCEITEQYAHDTETVMTVCDRSVWREADDVVALRDGAYGILA